MVRSRTMPWCCHIWTIVRLCGRSVRQKIEQVLSKSPRTPSEGNYSGSLLRKGREMSRIALVHRCATKGAPQCLCVRLKCWDGKEGDTGRRHSKLFVPQANTSYFRKSFTFEGIKSWNCLPSEMRRFVRRQLRSLLLTG